MPGKGRNVRSQSDTNNKRRQDGEGTESQDGQESSDSGRAHKKVRWEGGSEISTNSENEDTEERSENTEKLCLATSCQFGRIGCAYYDPVKCTLYVFEDTQENQHYDLAKALLEQCGPDIVITSSKADDNFIDILRDQSELVTIAFFEMITRCTTVDSSGGTFQIRPYKDFSPVKGRDRVLSLRLLSELPPETCRDLPSSGSDSSNGPRNAYDFMRHRRQVGGDPTMQRWNASIRLANYAAVESSPLCLGCIGALLDYLARIRALGELDDTGIGGLEIRAIQALRPSQFMQINADALSSLQIFEDETHASIHSDKTKEGLSLYGILNGTKTTLGRSLLREWLLRPLLSLPAVNARHDAIACFICPENQIIAGAMHTQLKGIKNIPRTLRIMKAGKATSSDWRDLVKFTYHSLMIRDALGELNHATSVDVIKRLIDALEVASFKEVGSAVNETIDWEESAITGRVCVRAHVDEELDNLKHIYHGIDTVLSKVAQQISASVPSDYASCLNVVYFPQLGFLICVPMLEEWKTEENITVLEGWSFQFSSESHVYFKSQEMHDMDAHIGDLHSSIVDREIEIVQSLLEQILVHDEAMGHACDVCAELDCLLSFAEASRAYNYVRPRMSEENIIDIKRGRHPLQELVVDTFVPNDAFVIGGAGTGSEALEHIAENESDENRREQNSIIVCTGANACGKSVYLKQVALIQYMAQIGCFVPAEAATLGVVDKIFTRIQTRESVSRVQSAFMIDLNQVSLALRNATNRSLILLDEFGKGTVSADGAGLFCGVLKHLALRGTACPKVLAATHFHDVFRDDLLSPRLLPITFVHMQVMLSTSQGHMLGASSVSEAESSDFNEAWEDEVEGRMVAPGERITYLYRVAKGFSLDSHAAMCAEIFGIPRRIANRARYVSKLLSTHELGQLLDEEMSEDERKDLEDAEDVCRRFLAWDLSRDDEKGRSVRQVLADVLGRSPGT